MASKARWSSGSSQHAVMCSSVMSYRSSRTTAASRFMAGRNRWPARGVLARPAGAGARWRPIGRGRRGSPGVRRWHRAGCAAGVRRAVRPTIRTAIGAEERDVRGAAPDLPAEHGAVRRRGAEPQAKPGPPARQRAPHAGWRVFEQDPGPLLGRTILHRAGSHDEGVLVIDAGEGAQRARIRRDRDLAHPVREFHSGLHPYTSVWMEARHYPRRLSTPRGRR